VLPGGKCVLLCRPEGHGPGGVEIVNVCGSPAWQALGVQSGRDCECFWITSFAGFRGKAWCSGDHAGPCKLRGAS
jgi:hypothetical protein